MHLGLQTQAASHHASPSLQRQLGDDVKEPSSRLEELQREHEAVLVEKGLAEALLGLWEARMRGAEGELEEQRRAHSCREDELKKRADDEVAVEVAVLGMMLDVVEEEARVSPSPPGCPWLKQPHQVAKPMFERSLGHA